MTRVCRLGVGSIVSLLAIFLLGTHITRAYIATEYDTTLDAPVGTLVSFDSDGTLIRSSLTAPAYVGVVTAAQGGKLAVASTGMTQVFVVDTTGPVRSGARIGVSAIAGVASVSRDSQPSIGTVVAAIDDGSPAWQNVTMKAANGTSQTVRVALTRVALQQNAGIAQPATSTFGSTVQKVADLIVGRSVELWRIITALIVCVAGILVAFGLLLSAGRGSFMALGRNPLAGTVILRGMWRVAVVSIGVVLAGIAGAYLLLRVGS